MILLQCVYGKTARLFCCAAKLRGEKRIRFSPSYNHYNGHMHKPKYRNRTDTAMILEIQSFDDPALDVYARLTENQLVNRADPENGLFIAESPNVILRALDAGYVPVSLLMERRHIEGQAREVVQRCGDIPLYTAPLPVLTELTGFPLTRGVLCAMRRRKLPAAEEITLDIPKGE